MDELTNLEREIQEDLAKEKARKTKAVQFWNIIGFFVAMGLVALLFLANDGYRFGRYFRGALIALILIIVGSIGKRSFWK